MVMVSVIIPAYNSQKTLAACVGSVLAQGYGSLEVIIVDDGSTDDTPRIADELQKGDGRIVVIHKRNEGVSTARNTGIRHAKGKYVLFLDSDDCHKPGIISRAVALAEARGADLVIFGFDYHLCDTGEIRGNEIAEDACGGPQQFFAKHFAALMDRELLNPPWNKLILRRLIADNGLQFAPQYAICEDMAFSADVLGASKQPAVLAGSGYEYMLRTSGTLVFRFNSNFYEALCNFYDSAMAYCRKFPANEAQIRCVNTRFVGMCIAYFRRIYEESGWGAAQKRGKLVAICESRYFRGALAAVGRRSFKKRVVCLLAKARLYGLLDVLYRTVYHG